MIVLPEPECEAGYPHSQLQAILEPAVLTALHRWLQGQTQTICSGELYDWETKQNVPSGCDRPHGYVAYKWDVERFIHGWNRGEIAAILD